MTLTPGETGAPVPAVQPADRRPAGEAAAEQESGPQRLFIVG